MINGCVVGIVEDNRDPDGMHRVLVSFPVDDGVKSSWCRMITPMGGMDRGLVTLPDIGTEVLLSYAYRSMTPFILGALYNGKGDEPEPYRNDDGNDDKRVFWSRNDHLVVFDDTQGEERVGVGAKAGKRLDVTSAPVHHVLDAAGKEVIEKCAGITLYEAKKKLSIKCRTFSLQADQVLLQAGRAVSIEAPQVDVQSRVIRTTSPDTQVRTGAMPPPCIPADPAAPCQHPPRKG
jgi:uncharacterized protein involved in type VI secretion and phage assembly